MNFAVLTNMTLGNCLYACWFYTSKVIGGSKLFQKANCLSELSLERRNGSLCCERWCRVTELREIKKKIKIRSSLNVIDWRICLNALGTVKQSLECIFKVDDSMHHNKY